VRRHLLVLPVAIAFACDCGSSSGARGVDAGAEGSVSSGPSPGPFAPDANSPSAEVDAGLDAPDAGQPAAPAETCMNAAQPVDTSKPTTVVGTGTPASCTESALDDAAAKGGIVTFDCGAAPATITVTSEIAVTKDTTIDGGHLVTLSGGMKTRILHIKSAWNVATPLLTVQHLALSDGYTTDVANTKSTSQGGAAIFEDGGSLTVIDCTFTNNRCATTGQDVSGGAINGQGVGTLIVEGSTFTGNVGSNGGAIGTQAENVTISNSVFSGNSATGTGGNPGNGGNGGAMSYDGAMVSWTMCGDTFSNNRANAAGGAIFRVAYTDEPVTIDRCTFDGNSVDPMTGNAGAAYLEYATIAMTDTTLSHNSAHFGGGIWIGHMAIAQLTNDTIADNRADMGGGVWFAGGVTGKLLHVTVANNAGNGMAGGDTGVTLENTLVAGNTAGSLEGEVSCDHTHAGAGANLEYPGDPSSPCTSAVIVSDPLLGMLQNNGGPTDTMAPAAGSPAIAKGTGCPPTDQRGQPRKASCTLGAYEVE
jgi:parallel beta helix pectate lyase-like protein/polymorphic membrane protein